MRKVTRDALDDFLVSIDHAPGQTWQGFCTDDLAKKVGGRSAAERMIVAGIDGGRLKFVGKFHRDNRAGGTSMKPHYAKVR